MIAALLYLPFGKFFHIFQRPAQLGVKLYQKAGEIDGGAFAPRCGASFASQMQIDDLREVLPQVGFDFSMPGPAEHWQAVCPPCKRKAWRLPNCGPRRACMAKTPQPVETWRANTDRRYSTLRLAAGWIPATGAARDW